MKDVTLVVLAAGMGSRYGGLKQIDPIGPNGEIILEMSAFDAIRAGFNKIVFIIKKAIEEDFKKAIGNKIADHIKVEYVFQEMDACLPEGYEIPADRVKPWGTAHAILCCKNVIHEPFAVINADDYYGIASFQKLHDYLVSNEDETAYSMVPAVSARWKTASWQVLMNAQELKDARARYSITKTIHGMMWMPILLFP